MLKSPVDKNHRQGRRCTFTPAISRLPKLALMTRFTNSLIWQYLNKNGKNENSADS